MITPQQVRDARSLLGWTTAKLADEAALGIKTLEAFEEGREPLVLVHKVVLREVLERAGVKIAEGKPAMLKTRRPAMRRLQVV